MRAYGLIVELPVGPNHEEPALRFISAGIAQRVVPRPVVSSLPSGHLGICLVDGVILPVVELGPGATELIVCELPRKGRAGYPSAPQSTETLAVSGARALASGAFDQRGDCVEYAGQLVEALDLELLQETVSARHQ